MCVRSSLIRRRYGADVNVESKESIGRDPFKQLPGKWSSDMVCTLRLSAVIRSIPSQGKWTHNSVDAS